MSVKLLKGDSPKREHQKKYLNAILYAQIAIKRFIMLGICRSDQVTWVRILLGQSTCSGTGAESGSSQLITGREQTRYGVSVYSGYGGSNPPLSTKKLPCCNGNKSVFHTEDLGSIPNGCIKCMYVVTVASENAILEVWVRFPVHAPICTCSSFGRAHRLQR